MVPGWLKGAVPAEPGGCSWRNLYRQIRRRRREARRLAERPAPSYRAGTAGACGVTRPCSPKTGWKDRQDWGHRAGGFRVRQRKWTPCASSCSCPWQPSCSRSWTGSICPWAESSPSSPSGSTTGRGCADLSTCWGWWWKSEELRCNPNPRECRCRSERGSEEWRLCSEGGRGEGDGYGSWGPRAGGNILFEAIQVSKMADVT